MLITHTKTLRVSTHFGTMDLESKTFQENGRTVEKSPIVRLIISEYEIEADKLQDELKTALAQFKESK